MLSNHTILSFIIIAVLSVILIVIAVINRQSTAKSKKQSRSKYIKCSTPKAENTPKSIVTDNIEFKPCHNCYFAVKLEQGTDGHGDRFIGCKCSSFYGLSQPIMSLSVGINNGIEIIDLSLFSGENNVCAAQHQIYFTNALNLL